MAGNQQPENEFIRDLEIVQSPYTIEVLNEEQKMIKLHLAGPPNTPYETGTYEILIIFPREYPRLVPQVKFLTPIWNIAVEPETGNVILDNVQQQNPIGLVIKNIEDMMTTVGLDEESMYYKSAKFWNALYANGNAGADDGWQQEKLQRLISMGFSSKPSLIALSTCDWKVPDAAEYVIENMQYDQ